MPRGKRFGVQLNQNTDMLLLKNFALFVFARVLLFGLGTLANLHTIVDQLRYGGSKKRLADSFFEGAYGLDVFANTTYPSFFNAYFLKKGGYHFGGSEETVSSALGKNWTMDKLTWMGEGCAGMLNLIDTDHCFKYIKGSWKHPKPERSVEWWKTLLFTLVLTAILALTSAFIFWAAFILVKAAIS